MVSKDHVVEIVSYMWNITRSYILVVLSIHCNYY